MQAEVHAVQKARIALVKKLERLGPAAREPLLLPDLVETPRIAAVARQNVLAADAQPSRDPDIDGVGLGQVPLGRT